MSKPFSSVKQCLAICAWLSFSCCFMMNARAAQTNSAASSLKISWSGATRELYAFAITPALSNCVQILLITDGKVVGKHIAASPGGMQSMLTLAGQAATEIAARKGQGTTQIEPESKRSLKITFTKAGKTQSFSVEGGMKELTQFFRSTTALKKILQLASEDQPKAYRLIDENGAAKAMMVPPNRQ